MELRDEVCSSCSSPSAPPPEADEILDEKQRLYERKIATLREVEPKAAAAAAAGDPFPYLVLRYGIESSEAAIAWCRRARAELEAEQEKTA